LNQHVAIFWVYLTLPISEAWGWGEPCKIRCSEDSFCRLFAESCVSTVTLANVSGRFFVCAL
jgi:hypothetical protein